jgi:hypothetical protein
MNPAEVVKQRMQMKFSPYGGSLECARYIYRSEGISAFYRSYTIQLASNVPYQAIHFMTYEFLQHVRVDFLKIITVYVLAIESRTQVRPKITLGGRWNSWRTCSRFNCAFRLYKNGIKYTAGSPS